MNPYKPVSPQSIAEDANSSRACVLTWGDHTLSVTAALIPRFLPVVGAFYVAVDGGPSISSSQLRLQEKFDFVINDKGREVPATFQSYGLAIGRQPFRITIDETHELESSVVVERWWPGFLLGICIGLLIVVVCLAILAGIALRL